MKLFAALIAPALLLLATADLQATEQRSPANQIYQFMQAGECAAWSDHSTNKAAVYLWIPETCHRLRGLVIMCANVPEHRLGGHPAIRSACELNDLGIIWGVPSFMNFRKDKEKGTDMAREHKTTVGFLQQLLDGLAKTSGYEEVATVPWLPVGESGHLLMVDALVEHSPQRCLAGVWVKNNHLPPQNRQTPALVIYGTAQEWGQEKTDVRTNWNNIPKAYEGILKQRQANPNWSLSFVLDGGSGHFDCSDRLAQYIGRYIAAVAQARLPDADNQPLKSVNIAKGFLADLPLPGRMARSAVAVNQAAPTDKSLPWYFDRTSADEARAIAAINWNAETQLPGFADAAGKILPFNFNGISCLTPEPEADGITFTLRAVMLDTLPENFVHAGDKLAKAPGKPVLEWLCGPVVPVAEDKFRIALDRSWPASACYIAARQRGNDKIRDVVQPCGIKLQKNTVGVPQTITFDFIPDVKAGTKTMALTAKSSAGLPVRFFVRAGPAVIEGDQLKFSTIPPRSKLPLTVTVAAWQWGRSTAPAVQTAGLVERQFKILPAE